MNGKVDFYNVHLRPDKYHLKWESDKIFVIL